MTKNLSILLLAAAMSSLTGCITSPTSLSSNVTLPSASDSTSSHELVSSIAPADLSPIYAPDSLGTGQSPTATASLKELERGQASWYGPRFHGRRTASGERYDQHALTAAHKTLPFGTLVRVRSLATSQEVDVRVTDRGPFTRGRVIDLSRAAAEALGMRGAGVRQVSLHVVESTTPVVNFYRAATAH